MHFAPLLLSAAVAVSAYAEVEKRQLGASGSLTPSTYVRRGFHASVVVKDTVYIDGGEVSYKSSNGSMNYRYSATMEAIDLSSDWTNSTVVVQTIAKPSNVPDLVKAGLWYDNQSNIVYSGFAGRQSYINNETGSLPEYPLGIWSNVPDGVDNTTFNTAIASTDALWQSLIRPCSGLISYGGGKGYVLGGSSAPDIRDDSVPAISGMLEFDFVQKTLVNTSIDGSLFAGGIHMGGMVYAPNLGTDGLLVVVGGEDSNLNLLPMNNVSIYDPAAGKWYVQPTTGVNPRPRKAHCIAGVVSEEGSYDIFMYGGWSGHATGANLPYDEIYILSLPAFEWTQVPYTPTSPRHTVTCQGVGGSQILTIGGLASDNTGPDSDAYLAVFDSEDPFAQGLNVFDMNKLSWADKYTANAPAYQQNSKISAMYTGSAPSYANSDVAALFKNSTAFKSSGKKLNVGAIAGGVVAGVILLTVILIVWRRMWAKKHRHQPIAREAGASEMGTAPPRYDDGRHEVPAKMSGEDSKMRGQHTYREGDAYELAT